MRTRRDVEAVCGSILVALVAGSAALAAVTFDGTLNFLSPGDEWANPEAAAVQANYTGFGNQTSTGGFTGGSELNQLFVKASDTDDVLYLGVTGNLETNGNAILVFFDTVAGGQTVLTGLGELEGPGALKGMENDVLETGFAADYVLHVDTFAGNGFVSWYDLTGTPTRTYRGKIGLSNGDNTLEEGTADGLVLAMDNTNVAGVTGDSAANAASATTGIEAAIPFSHLGISGLPHSQDLKIQAIIVSGGGFVSNQSLHPLADGTGNPGNEVNYETLPGTQTATVPLVDTTWDGNIDGQNIPDDFDAPGDLISTQTLPTQFGDQQASLNRGSELDQLFAQENGDQLEIGITGNLEFGGQNLVILLDTIPDAGETTLTNNPGRLAGNNGDTLPCAADYAIVMNIFAGDLFVDLIDLTGDTTTYLGKDPVNNGDGVLQDGAGEGWTIILNSDNVVGVTGQAEDDPQTANALTATTGWEISIPLTAVGSPAQGTSIGIIAMVTGGSDDRPVSNQILPSLASGGQPNPNNGPDENGANLASLGYQCLTMVIGEPPPECHDPRFDADGDQDVDQEDFAVFQLCYTGENVGPVSPECTCFDWNLSESDGDIDQEDYGFFQRCAVGSEVDSIHGSGPTIPADPACDNALAL
jgi:hypothetical protein